MDANPAVLQKQRLSKRFMNAMKRILGKSLKEINKKYKNEVTQYKKRQFKEIKQGLLRYRVQKKTAAKEANAAKKAQNEADKEANSAKKAEKEAAKEAKAAKKAEKEAAKEAKAAKKVQNEADKEAKAAKKAEKEAINKAAKEAKVAKKAEKEAAKEAKVAKKAEKEAAKEAKAVKKAEKEAAKEAKVAKKAEKEAVKEAKVAKKAEKTAAKEAKVAKKIIKNEQYINLKLVGKLDEVTDEQLTQQVYTHFTTAMNSKEWWRGLVVMENGAWLEDENVAFEWQEHAEVFNLHFERKNSVVYFKLLPKYNYKYEASDGFDGEIKLTNKPGRKKQIKENSETVSMMDQLRQDFVSHEQATVKA